MEIGDNGNKSSICKTNHFYSTDPAIVWKCSMKHFSVSDSGKIIFRRRLALFSVIKDRRKYFPLKWRKTNLGYFLPLGWNIKIMGSTYSYYHQMNLIQMFFEAGRSWPVKKVSLLLTRSLLKHDMTTTQIKYVYYEKLVKSIPLCVKLFDLVIAVRRTSFGILK